MCQFNSYRPGDSTYEALAPRRPRSIHKIQIKIIYLRREYRGVWVGGCGAPESVARARELGVQRRRDAWRYGRGGGDGACVQVPAGAARGPPGPALGRSSAGRTPPARAANTHYSIHNDMHAVKLASKTRFSFICAQFHMIHDFLCDVKSRALRRSVSNLLCSFI